jgi:hypothetical protein
MESNDEDRGRSRRLGAEDRGWSSTDQVMLCVVCTVHKEMWSADSLVQPRNKGRRFSRFGLKIGGYDSCGLASKLLAGVSRFGPQNQ